MSSGNYMQRVFDLLLRVSPELLTITEISRHTGMEEAAVRKTLERLRHVRSLKSVCEERVWRYGVKASAQRPRDNRGQRKRETA